MEICLTRVMRLGTIAASFAGLVVGVYVTVWMLYGVYFWGIRTHSLLGGLVYV